MKRAILPLFFCFFLTACFGGGPREKTPAHIFAGDTQTVRGLSWYEKGCNKRALEHFFRAHELFSATGQERKVAMSLNNIGTVYRANKDLESADAFFAESALIYQGLDDGKGQRQALVNRAAVAIDREDFNQARVFLDSAGQVSAGPEESPFVPLLNNRAVLAIKTRNFAHARDLLDQALALPPGSVSGRATLYYTLGTLLLEEKHYQAAAEAFEKALAGDRDLGFYKGMADDLYGMGKAWLAGREPARAVGALKRATRIYALTGREQKAMEVLEKMKQAASAIGENTIVTEMFITRWLEGKNYEKPCQ